MKSNFAGFYSTPNEKLRDIWSADSTLFVFDTNCLLNLYRCEKHTRDDILGVMKKISNRIWIPFQVAYEYQKNRRVVIEESVKSLTKIKNYLSDIYTQNILSSGGVKKHLYNSLNDELHELQLKIKKPIDEYINKQIEQRIKDKISISEHDFIRESIDSIILDRVGSLPTLEEIEKIDKLGQERYENKTPPGFRDEGKQTFSIFSEVKLQDKYGDLYLWMQIIEKAKSEDIKSVIFVCDDNKPDWWFIHNGKTHGPLESLKTEICKKANIENFKMINQLSFLNEAKSNIQNIEISESSLKEVEKLSNGSIAVNESCDSYNADTNWGEFFSDKSSFKIYKNEAIIKKHLDKFRYNPDEPYDLINLTNTTLNESNKTLANGYSVLDKLYVNRHELIAATGDDIYNKIGDELKTSLTVLEFFIKRSKRKLEEVDWHSENSSKEINTANRSLLNAFYNAEKSIASVIGYLAILDNKG